MNKILQKAEFFITDLYNKKLDKDFIFHSLDHTRRTVKAVNLIGEKEGVTPSDLEILNLAAWFHDAGYTEKYDNHEKSSHSWINDISRNISNRTSPRPHR